MAGFPSSSCSSARMATLRSLESDTQNVMAWPGEQMRRSSGEEPVDIESREGVGGEENGEWKGR